MKITTICGSPKSKNSDCLSLRIIHEFEKLSGEKVKNYQAVRLVKTETPPEVLSEILDSDAIVIVFPLYVDSMPAPLIELLTRLESAALTKSCSPTVYAFCNCGFYESVQTETVLKMVEHFAKRAGLTWGYGIGVGGGPMLSSMGEDWSKGPASDVNNAIRCLVTAIKGGKRGKNILIDPKIPRFAYMAIGNLGWYIDAVKNHIKNLKATPYIK